MRPPAIEKMGYYPTNLPVVELIAQFIHPANEPSVLLDPCAGEGEAAALLGERLGCTTWGVELSPFRADKAAEKLNLVHACGWEQCVLTDESVNLLFLNPPYDDDRLGGNKRLELSFLHSTTPKLVKGGLLVYIVPQRILAMPEIARFLVGHYDVLNFYKFHGEFYNLFGQCIVFGYRRQQYRTPSESEIIAIQQLAAAELSPIDVPADSRPVYHLLPWSPRNAGGVSIRFRRKDWSDAALVEATISDGVLSSTAFKDAVSPARKSQNLQPLMPLRRGHVSSLMASGLLGTVSHQKADGTNLLIKGRIVKTTETFYEQQQDGTEAQIIKDRYITTIVTVDEAGNLDTISELSRLEAFMQEYGEALAHHILESFTPLYNFDPLDAEAAVLDTLGKNRKALPGQPEPGLLTSQRHAVLAATRGLKKNKTVLIQGEMGLGKTSIAAAALAVLDAFPAIVLCPPNLVEKWQREIVEVIPNAHAEILTRIGKTAAMPCEVNDVRSFMVRYENEKRRTGTNPRWVAIISDTTAKLGSGWASAAGRKTVGTVVDGILEQSALVRCPVCGGVQYETLDQVTRPILDDGRFDRKRQFCTSTIKGWQLDEDGRKMLDETGNPVWGERVCGAALFSQSQMRRVSVAEYISKHAKGFFKALIPDEIHQYKGKSSDRGVAFHQLVESVEYVLPLTGTLFGGMSTSIFWLLYRLFPAIRDDFGFHDEMRWASLYGVVQRKRKNTEETRDGHFSGNRRYTESVKELPGISPEIVAFLLNNVIFLTLKDLNAFLPAYHETVASPTMSPDQAEQYSSMFSALKAAMHKDYKLASSWLQWSLCRPNSGFRDETASLPDSVSIPLPKVISDETPLLPKERWLVDFCVAEKAAGRKVLVYVRQTDTRDIRPRLESLLKAAGVRPVVLKSSVSATKRESWIKQHTWNTDALIVNPRLVETGLDLVMFSTVVFYEIEYSLYTLWQAVRRVWRLGQTKPVKAVYTAYRSTLEADALALMGKKLKAAQMLFGDDVGGAIVEEEDGDLLSNLARQVISGVRLDDLQSLFTSGASDFSEIVIPAPAEVVTVTARDADTVMVESWDKWMSERNLKRSDIGTSRKSKKTEVQVVQTALF